ncbi:hypothetical protein DS742_17810 [Lacrimispora amygdalina]|uniref:Uncharacterized protein n=1 Tax=Lacrimispora amygdalina TaxID=253257 RepID=A0A3E2N9H4_9FIRM|nr:hypothetical protein DS742_17810 [Clostridium indicum]
MQKWRVRDNGTPPLLILSAIIIIMMMMVVAAGIIASCSKTGPVCSSYLLCAFHIITVVVTITIAIAAAIIVAITTAIISTTPETSHIKYPPFLSCTVLYGTIRQDVNGIDETCPACSHNIRTCIYYYYRTRYQRSGDNGYGRKLPHNRLYQCKQLIFRAVRLYISG